MTQEALKIALDALETELSIDWTNNDEFNASAEKMHEAIVAIKEALAQTQEPVAWRTFDGEGGYDYRSYQDNESYADEWDKRNPNHKGWVEPLYTHPLQPSATAGYAAKIESLIAERDELTHEIQKLQIALAFWLPNVPANDSKFAERCANDAYLLVGCQGEIEPSAQKLGWIKTEQEPVADDFFRMIADRNPKPFPPPQRTWVGLSEEKIEYVWRKVETSDFHDCVLLFAKELEAELKKENGYAEEKNS